MKNLLVSFLIVGYGDGFVVLPTIPTKETLRNSKWTFGPMSIATDSELHLDDNSIADYSRCLTPSQENDQMKEEFGIKIETTWRKRILKKPFKIVRRVLEKSLESNKKHGALILVRCGECEYSGKNPKFAGWDDPALTVKGVQQMEHSGRLLLESGYEPDVVYTSRLKRAIKSAWVIVQEVNLPFIPMRKSWRLNERHYGSLQGLSKKDMANSLGVDIVQSWRRSLTARPPPVDIDSSHYPGNNRKFSDLRPEQIPQSESLLDCMKRTEPLWNFVKRDLEKGENVMVVAHANTLRGLAKIIDDIGDLDIADVSFPVGIPCVYKFDACMNPLVPTDDNLKQIHTNGIFVEKPDLLKKAMQNLKEEDEVPGSRDIYLGQNMKRNIIVEKTLLRLEQDKGGWERKERVKHKEVSDVICGQTTGHKSSKLVAEIEINNEDNEKAEQTPEVIDATDDAHVVFIRHGRTPHNKLSLFTGWEDAPLAEEGEEEAKWAGRLLKKHGFEFDVVYTSWLYRAIQTALFALEELDQLDLPVVKSWRLNERHYGDLTGKSKKMIANIYGKDQLKKWRRGYKVRPPKVSSYSVYYPGNDKRRIKHVTDLPISLTETFCRSVEERKLSIHRKFPKCESLFDCMNRSIPFYTERIVPEAVSKGKSVLIAGHENAIRGILMHLCEIPEDSMNDLNLPNGVPLVYSVKRRCITLLDEGTNEDLKQKYDFGSAAQYLFESHDQHGNEG